MTDWFSVSKEGLKKLIAGRPKVFVLFELYQNGGLDTKATHIEMTLEPISGRRGRCRLIVDDDHPEGFKDLTHLWTLYAESEKKGDPEKAGRFNQACKFILAMCETATVSTTTGTVVFNKKGRHKSRAKRDAGSRFDAVIEMTRQECTQAIKDFQMLIPRKGLTVSLNGDKVHSREPMCTFEATLPTINCDEEGYIKPSKRKTTVSVYTTTGEEVGSIYELGIPVCSTGDSYHVSIGQKIPLNSDRDNVTQAYLQTIRTLTFNHVHEELDKEEMTETWVRAATEDKRCDSKAYESAMEARFGKKRAIYDMSDRESNDSVVTKGYALIYSGSLSRGEHDNNKAFGTTLPAGQIAPSPKPYSEDGDPLSIIPADDWTDGMRKIAKFAVAVGREVLDTRVKVIITNDAQWGFAATFGRSGDLVLNVGALGYRWFEDGITRDVVDLFTHEFGHYYESNHLNEKYHKALTRIGAAITFMALTAPELFR